MWRIGREVDIDIDVWNVVKVTGDNGDDDDM